jgi:hypothetical protein
VLFRDYCENDEQEDDNAHGYAEIAWVFLVFLPYRRHDDRVSMALIAHIDYG